MLSALRTDTRAVLYRTLTLLSMICCALVVSSFVMFADDQLASASRRQQNALATGVASAARTGPQVHPRGQPGRFIDTAASTLTSPFRSIVQSGDQWVRRGVPTVLALAFYGLGLGYLARYSRA